MKSCAPLKSFCCGLHDLHRWIEKDRIPAAEGARP
jgi:hypothetical protein